MKYKNIADMHTHSIHSFDGNDECIKLCKSAADKGAVIIAVTDHCDIDGKDMDENALCAAELEDIEKCQRELDGKIKILKGLEIGQGIYRRERTRQLLENFEFDFILGSLHNLENMEDFFFLDYSKFDVYELLTRYFDDLISLCEWGAFDSLAHLTYPLRYIVAREKINVDMTYFAKKTDEILSLLIEKDKAIEINTSGLFMDMADTLPNISVIKRYKELGGKYVTVGSDSHYADRVCRGIDRAYDMLLDTGFDCVTVFEKRQPMLLPIK